MRHSPSFQSENRLECRLHYKPIKSVTLRESGRDYKMHCEDCLHEQDKSKTRNGSTTNFLIPENCHIFDEQMRQFKDAQLEKVTNIKNYLSSLEKTFEEFIEIVRNKKTALQEALQLEFDTQNDIISQAETNYKTYQQHFKNLLRGIGDERLLEETIQLYFEVSRNTNLQTGFKLENQEFRKTSDLFNSFSTLLLTTKKTLEEFFIQAKPPHSIESFRSKKSFFRPPRDVSPLLSRKIESSYNSNNNKSEAEQSYRGQLSNRSSVSPNLAKRKSSKTLFPMYRPSYTVKRASSTSNKENSSFARYNPAVNPSTSRDISPNYSSLGHNNSTHNANNASTLKAGTPRSDIYGPKSNVFDTPRGGLPHLKESHHLKDSPSSKKVVFDDEKLRLTKQIVDTPINCHMLETKMKSIDAMTYLPKKQLLVYGGSLHGDQHTSIVFYRMDSSPKVLKTTSAHSQTITALVYVGKMFFSCSKDCLVKLWDLTNFVPLLILKHSSAVLGVTIHEKRNIAFTYGHFPDVRVWDLNDLSDWFIKIKKSNFVTQLHFVETREWLVATNGQSGVINVIDYRSGDTLFELDDQSPAGYDDLDFDVERNRLLTAGSDGAIKIWNFETGDPFLEKTINFKYKGGYTSTNSLLADFKEDLLFMTNSRNNFWVGKISEGVMVGFLNWMEVGVKNIHKILYIKKRQWILAANRNNGKIAIISLKEIKKNFLEGAAKE